MNTIAFDKTGTLTYGTPKVIHVECCGELSEPELFQMAATAEIFSEHPLGKAVTASYQKKYGTAIPKPDKSARAFWWNKPEKRCLPETKSCWQTTRSLSRTLRQMLQKAIWNRAAR